MKKSKKTISPRKDRVALVVGEDLQIAQIADLHGRAIVQKFVGRRMALHTVLFNAKEESLSNLPTWIKLLNLPLEFWSKAGLKPISDSLGKFIMSEKNYLSSNYRSVAQILVDIDPWKGLFESLDIVLGEKTFIQQLDYMHIPFRCASCHWAGHLHVDCNLILRRPRLREDMQEFQAKILTPPQKLTKASNISTFQKNPTPKAISPTLHAEQPKELPEKLD